MRVKIISAAVAFAVVAQPSLAAAQCSMTQLPRHVDPARTRIYAASQGTPSLYFRADLDVNTDGSSRSYHPNDPHGRTLALNNIANAISAIWNGAGQRIDCAPRRGACYTRYIDTFVAARNSDWAVSGHPRVATAGMIPWQHDARLGRRAPCTIQSGPFRGYFVSPTAFVADPSKGECDQARYLDSLAFNAAVLPRNVTWASMDRRARLGDLVAVRSPQSGRVAYAILGDTGPARSIGEGTIALAAALRGESVSPAATYQQVRALALGDVQYLVFAGANIRSLVNGQLTQAAINREGERLLRAWGGAERLAQCATLRRP